MVVVVMLVIVVMDEVDILTLTMMMVVVVMVCVRMGLSRAFFQLFHQTLAGLELFGEQGTCRRAGELIQILAAFIVANQDSTEGISRGATHGNHADRSRCGAESGDKLGHAYSGQ